MRILVTGGAGYIGSHTVLALLRDRHEVIVLDNLGNGHEEALRRVAELAGREALFVRADITDRNSLNAVFREQDDIDAVLHFAGLKAVGESVREPLRYYRSNVLGTKNLCEVMSEYGVQRIVFSSSATVYGAAARMPVTEDAALSPTNPYGHSKLAVEEYLRGWQAEDTVRQATLLRYFNPVGADASGRLGEDPRDTPNNLMPYITQVAVGRLPQLQVFGDDYDTPDGTGVRDYIHVSDLADGHVSALTGFLRHSGVQVFNLGTGQGYSVLDMIRAFEHVTGQRVPYRVVSRRDGDVATCYADVGRAREKLGWQAGQGLEAMVADAWRWQQQNPQGYRSGV